MSWFSSLFSSSKPPPATSGAAQPPALDHRILEEPVRQPEREPVVEAAQPSPSPLPSKQLDRPNRNAVIFGAGAAFFVFSLLITRRAFARKRLASSPAFYANAPGHQAEQAKNVNGAMEALEALNLATVNVLSLSMMATGGTLWYLNINSVADARRMIRGGLGVDGTGRSEKDAEEDFEEWLATTLARKEAKGSGAQEAQAKMNERGQQR
ncbi:hypothetical protein A1O7_00690 [Cladophialophora yegresii CBS 114405]|uniref:Altered inheritance of mitochondria protein 11 n=1 Tax=Cladophialophora yegresii CBS 114405 TaxID=1182544 RepID=W9X1K3_9EURO|nr:uncharacterized protein A1O7_00690 [Cladophialophora yegresii CBS 114405]EXJ64354.1 hypothetical protein A1O7_00690 [Cladophialophora yegresii CBS 114405]